MIDPALEDEVREALRELVHEIRAVSASIVEDDDARSGVPARTLPLGGGEYLRVELGTRSSHEHPIEATLERAVRQLRAIRRRWDVPRLPDVTVSASAAPTSARIIDRVASYLQALASVDRATNALVARGRRGAAPILVAAARPPDELEQARWPFLARRVLATHAPGSSYGEIVDPDAFAMSFLYDYTLIVLVREGYGVDFVRHRCRQVARELANLLPMLEPDPETPASVRRPDPA